MGRDRLTRHGRYAAPGGGGGGGSTPYYDNRYGTDTTTAASTGWFTFGLHSGNKRIWCDASKADDSGLGTSAATAKKTIDAAHTLFLSGFVSGDQLMIAGTGGRTYSATLTTSLGGLGGISVAYPTTMLSYDPADAANAAKYGKLVGADKPRIQVNSGCKMFGNGGNFDDNYFAFQGLYFDGLGIDSAGISFQAGRHDGCIWQNCTFNAVELTVNQGGNYDATGASYYQGLNLSKNAFFGAWASSANSAGAYIHGINGAYIQDNVSAHGGWRFGSSRDDGTLGGVISGVNHSYYLSPLNKGTRFDRNLSADAAGDGVNMRGPGDITSVVSLDEPIPGYLGTGTADVVVEEPDGIVIHCDDWLIMGAADYNSSFPARSGPETTNTVGDSYLRNVAAFDNPKFGLGGDYFFQPFNNSGHDIVSITHSGTTATVTTATVHNLITGRHVFVYAASPSAYNVSDVAITVTSSTTFTYTMLSTPGTNATSVGRYTAQPVQSLLVDKVRSFNYAQTFQPDPTTFQIPPAINNTFTDIISDQLAPGAGNQVASSGLFPNYKTRDQVVTAVLNGIGITPGANYYARKSQLINAALYRPDLPWSQWLIGVGFPAMGLTPLYTTPAYATYTDTPETIYTTALGNLSISTLNFTHGVAGSALLSGVGALPVMSCSDLPSGLSISGRVISGTPVSAGTPTIHVVETSQDGTASHTTAFTLNIS